MSKVRQLLSSDIEWIRPAIRRSDVPPRWNPVGHADHDRFISNCAWSGVYANRVASVGDHFALVQVHDVDIRYRVAQLSILTSQPRLGAGPLGAALSDSMVDALRSLDVAVVLLKVTSGQADHLQAAFSVGFEHSATLPRFERVGDEWLDVSIAQLSSLTELRREG